MALPKRVEERVVAGIKQFIPVLEGARARDIGEADTVTIVTDMLAVLYGYDKYTEVTSEYAIKGTFCDLAAKVDGRLQLLLEVKAIGMELKDQHVKQAVDYAANQGVEWVVLTNGVKWRVYRITFAKPIDNELVIEFDFLALNPKSHADLETVFLLCKEGWCKSVLGDFHTQRQALSRFYLGAVVLSEPVLDVIRRELRRMIPDARVDNEQISRAMCDHPARGRVAGDHRPAWRARWRRLAFLDEPLDGGLGDRLVDLDADRAEAAPARGDQRRARAGERIEHGGVRAFHDLEYLIEKGERFLRHVHAAGPGMRMEEVTTVRAATQRPRPARPPGDELSMLTPPSEQSPSRAFDPRKQSAPRQS